MSIEIKRIQVRQGTVAQLAGITPASGELCWTTDTNLLKIGDGTTAGGIDPLNAPAGFSPTTKADVLQAAEFAADAGASDTYAATLSPAITAYVTGARYRFKANTANTGAATLNLNGLGAKTIVKLAGGITTALADNDIRAGQWVEVVYDGTNLQMLSQIGNVGFSQGTGLTVTDAGFRGIPINSQSADYTAVAADNGKCILHPSSDATPRTFTIPANVSVAYDVGAAITFDNDSAGAVTIAINSDTLVMAGAGTTGSRTLAQHGQATAVKIGATRWKINGINLT